MIKLNYWTVILAVLALLGCAESDSHVATNSEPDHDHEHHLEGEEEHHDHELGTPGPNGGRILTSVTPNVEFLVLEDRRIQLTPVDENAEPIPLNELQFSLIGGDRQDPTEMAFAPKDQTMISDAVLPEGNMIPVVLTITPASGEEPVVERFNIDFSICPDCDLQEYACICAH